MVRVPLYAVDEVDVARAVRWLDQHWGGAVFIPDELRDVAAVGDAAPLSRSANVGSATGSATGCAFPGLPGTHDPHG